MLDNTGLRIPDQAVCPGHQAPFDYLWAAFREPTRDMVVWAPRGGGKTRLGALATLLDLIHKPGCQVRILGGSLEQSLRMWEHLLPDVEQHGQGLWVARAGRQKRIALTNGSSAAVLAQSQYAVRGLRVQKLRCDEVELFDPAVWEAAQLVTRSTSSPPVINGSIEAISTHHLSHGMMHRILGSAKQNRTPIIHWCLMEVLERCPMERPCSTCALHDDCKGVAKHSCNGFFPIDDAIAMKRRVSKETWESEMLCRRPSTKGRVFPAFTPEIHVRDPLPTLAPWRGSLAIDFGFHAPFVCLWVMDDGITCHVVDEYVQSSRMVSDHLTEIRTRSWGAFNRICCDPAGGARNDPTAESNVQFFRRNGYKVVTSASHIADGLEMIRCALRPAAGEPTLFIHPRCKNLIRAMREYRYPENAGELPLKDGEHDHSIDALRYFYVNRNKSSVVQSGRAY